MGYLLKDKTFELVCDENSVAFDRVTDIFNKIYCTDDLILDVKKLSKMKLSLRITKDTDDEKVTINDVTYFLPDFMDRLDLEKAVEIVSYIFKDLHYKIEKVEQGYKTIIYLLAPDWDYWRSEEKRLEKGEK